MAKGIDDGLLLALAMKKGGGGGTSNYPDLTNKPTIEGKELLGNMSLSDIGDIPIPDEDIVSAVQEAFDN